MYPPDTPRPDADTFAPLLKEDLTSEDPPFIITNPLQVLDFAVDDGFAEAYLESLDNILLNTACGFHGLDTPLNPSAPLNREQWLRTAAQLIAAIQQGTQRNYDTSDIDNPYSRATQNKVNTLQALARANRNLNSFFTKENVKGPNNSNQCIRCLQVSGSTVLPEHWEAQLLTCNQLVAATCSTLINRYTQEFTREMETWLGNQRITAQNQIIETVINEHPPPHQERDPRVIEWVNRKADTLRSSAQVAAK